MFESDTFKVPQEIIDALRAKHCDSCNICKGRRLLEDDDGPYKCVCVKKFNQENLPKKFYHLTKDDLDKDFVKHNPGIGQVANYSDRLPKMLELGKGLFLQGENGAGKSFIATLILRKALEMGYTSYFILQRDLVNTAFAALYDDDIRADLERLNGLT